MTVELHVQFYCKYEQFRDLQKVTFARAYKFVDKPDDKTPRSMVFLYSEKAKRYVWAHLYFMDWQSNQLMHPQMNRDIMRAALRRIGLDLR